MSKKRVILKELTSSRGNEEAAVYPHSYTKRGVEYFNYIVRGWREGGKWQRKQFSDRAKAEAFADSVNINLKNAGRERRLVLTALDEDRVHQAEKAFRTLGDAYSLDDAVEFFLKYNRPPDFTISILDGLKIYLDGKEAEGVRTPTTKKTKMILKSFAKHAGNPLVHTVTEQSITGYLKSLRSLDGVTTAKKKTWNNHRNELASFFQWAGKKDLATNRPWTFSNPTEHIGAHSAKRVAEQRPDIATTSPEKTREIFTFLMNYKEGRLVKWFALAYFAGIRPSTDQGELAKLSEREGELINRATGRIMIPADASKTKDSRPVVISANLAAWLEAYEGSPIMPANLKNDYRTIRKKFGLQNDEPRHSFISYHVAMHRSIGDTALQAGNSERMIKKHYLDHHSQSDGNLFFSIVPGPSKTEAVFQKVETPEDAKVANIETGRASA
jgi:hypothetical protein